MTHSVQFHEGDCERHQRDVSRLVKELQTATDALTASIILRDEAKAREVGA